MNDGVRPLHGYAGPEFDLPLKNVQWNFLVPEGYDYSDFGGTLIVNEDLLDRAIVTEYDINAYESEVMQANVKDLRQAVELQTKGNQLAQQGEQYQARQALERAYNYSFSDPALNEDTRVQLNNLIRQQAVVGLIGRRGRLRSEGKDPQPAAQGKAADLGDRFNTADAERLTNMLSKDDSENLERITTRLIQTQEAAAGTPIQLVINVPLRGRRLEFNRALQVNPNTPMNVSFTASRRTQARTWLGRLYACGIFLCLFAAASAGAWASRKRPPRPTATAEPPAIEPPPARSNDPEPPAPPAAEPMTDEGDSNEHDAPDESEPEASEEKREE